MKVLQISTERKAELRPKTIDVNCLEWFDKANGNSYFAALVTLDFGTANETIIKLPFQYGYGDYYMEAAKQALVDSGHLPTDIKGFALSTWCRDNDVILRYDKRKNCLQRELKSLTL